MPHILAKIGSSINVATYEHYCDTIADRDKIDPREINLGSTCIVIEGESGGVEAYIANSNKEWKSFSGGSGSGSVTPEPIDESTSIDTVETLFEVIGNDEPQVSVKLNSDLDLNRVITVPAGKELTINLNDKNIQTTTILFYINGGKVTLEGNGNVTASSNIAHIVNGGTVIVNGGTYDSTATNYGFGAVGYGSKIEFNNGELTTTEGGLMAFDGGEIIFNGGTLNTRDNFAIATNGSAGRGNNIITMNGGTINAHITSAGYEAIGIYLPNDDTFVMNGGEIIANDGAGIVQRGGSALIRGGTITATGTPGTSGYVGDKKVKMSKSAYIYHQSADYPARDSIKLVITGGTFNGIDHSLEILSNEETPRVTVSGGTFNPAYPEA